MAAPKKVDYERIEPGWRAGIKSPAQLAAEYTQDTGVSVSHAAIIKHFKKLGVPRDLREKVLAKADAMVMQAMVTGKVSPATIVKDSRLIEQGAIDVAQVRMSHRFDISRMRALVMRLLAECEAETADPEVFADLGEMMRSPDANGQDRMADAYRKAISLPQRIKGVKELADAMRILVTMEREAYGIGDLAADSPATKTADAVIERMNRARGLGVRTALLPGVAMDLGVTDA